jgi:hypothetical protein
MKYVECWNGGICAQANHLRTTHAGSLGAISLGPSKVRTIMIGKSPVLSYYFCVIGQMVEMIKKNLRKALIFLAFNAIIHPLL